MAVTVVGQGSAAATSVAIPAHQAGDLIIVAARGTAAAPSVPAASGTVPAWATLQSGLANSVGLTVVAFAATATNTTTGAFTNATHICVLVLRPGAGKKLQTAAARSAVGNGNNTQTIVYPALTLNNGGGAGTSYGVRVGTRTVAAATVGTAIPAGWTNQTIQPAGASALMAVHVRAALAANPTADSVSTTGTNAAYRAVTVEVEEVSLVTSVSVSGLASAAAFGTSSFLTPGPAQNVLVAALNPYPDLLSIAGQFLVGDGHLVGGSPDTGSHFGVPTTVITFGTNVPVGAVGSAAAFGAPSAKATITKLVGGVASAGAFVAPVTVPRTTVPVGGRASGQSFGTPTAKGAVTRQVGAVASAQAFGSVALAGTNAVLVPGLVQGVSRFGAPGILAGATSRTVGAVASAQSFGTLSANLGKTAGGVSSGQAFGTPVILPRITRTVGAVASAASFGAPVAKAITTCPVTGLGSAQSFGVLTLQIGRPVGGVSSARAFGQVTIYVPPQFVQVPGLKHGPDWTIVGTFLVGQRLVGWTGGENLWGQVTPLPGPVSRTVTGIGSAQQFGVVRPAFVVHPTSVPSKQAFGTITPIAGPVWITVAGVASTARVGRPRVFNVFMLPTVPREEILLPTDPEDVALVPSGAVEEDWILVPTAEESWTLVPTTEEEDELLLVPTPEW